jgi:Na+/phosphate symporter
VKREFDTFGKTQSEIKQHNKRTRKTRVRELCDKYNTTSYSEASYLDTLDLCARINARLATLKK